MGQRRALRRSPRPPSPLLALFRAAVARQCFKASGLLTYTETAEPVLFDAPGNAAFTTEVGQITGTISGVGNEEDCKGDR